MTGGTAVLASPRQQGPVQCRLDHSKRASDLRKLTCYVSLHHPGYVRSGPLVSPTNPDYAAPLLFSPHFTENATAMPTSRSSVCHVVACPSRHIPYAKRHRVLSYTDSLSDTTERVRFDTSAHAFRWRARLVYVGSAAVITRAIAA